jgi:xanthosine utilization system XapX-like protein
VFLVTTFTSGATAVASQIVSDPAQAIPLLSKNLPKASNFYIAYFVLYGVANAARYLFSLVGLLGILILSKLDKTPRKKYMRYVSLMEPSWGAEYPKWTNLGVIAIAYAVIAPLVLGFATVGLGLLYVAYRYNMLYVYNTQLDTKGAFYARALEQIMVGVYLGELCLLGLFGIGVGSQLNAIGPVVLQVVLIATTIVFHILVKTKLKPSITSLPLEDPSESSSGSGERRGRSEEGLVSDVPSEPGNRHDTQDFIGNYTVSHNAQEKEPFYKRLFTIRQASLSQISASLAPHFRQPVPAFTQQEVLEAYMHPALAEQEPVIWLARDPAGISSRECEELKQRVGRYGLEATDHGAVMNEKGKVEWVDESVTDAPLWERKIVY